MRTVVVVATVSALVMGVFIVSPPGGFADEAVRITGEAREVQLGETRLQLIPTNRGVFIVQGELVNDKLTTVMLMEGARPAQIKMTPHTHRQTLVVHRELEEQLKEEIEENARIQGD
ncbi:MAG TPA: hypothetical protein VLK82_08465 [Candidatus Tectomicrobia bacterium]|nr:hypothetical protein [Candidatus Tectomicrobia bacterium]